MSKFSRWLAVAFAMVLAVAEMARNKDGWQWWPFWTVDYLAVGLLLFGAFGWRRGEAPNPLLTGAWGFSCAMFWMSFFGHLDDARRGAAAGDGDMTLTSVIGLMFALTVIGFVTSLVGALRSPRRSA